MPMVRGYRSGVSGALAALSLERGPRVSNGCGGSATTVLLSPPARPAPPPDASCRAFASASYKGVRGR